MAQGIAIDTASLPTVTKPTQLFQCYRSAQTRARCHEPNTSGMRHVYRGHARPTSRTWRSPDVLIARFAANKNFACWQQRSTCLGPDVAPRWQQNAPCHVLLASRHGSGLATHRSRDAAANLPKEAQGFHQCMWRRLRAWSLGANQARTGDAGRQSQAWDCWRLETTEGFVRTSYAVSQRRSNYRAKTQRQAAQIPCCRALDFAKFLALGFPNNPVACWLEHVQSSAGWSRAT